MCFLFCFVLFCFLTGDYPAPRAVLTGHDHEVVCVSVCAELGLVISGAKGQKCFYDLSLKILRAFFVVILNIPASHIYFKQSKSPLLRCVVFLRESTVTLNVNCLLSWTYQVWTQIKFLPTISLCYYSPQVWKSSQ